MPDYDWNRIVAALAHAEEGRTSLQGIRPARSRDLADISQRYAKRIAEKLTDADREDLDQIRAQHQAEARRISETEKHRAIEESFERMALLDSQVAASRAAIEGLLSTDGPANPQFHDRTILNLARSLSLRGETVLDERQNGTALEPWANRAKVSSNWGSVDHLGLESGIVFEFVWSNPSDHAVVVDIASAVALGGFGVVGANSSFFGDNSTHLTVSTFLQPLVPFVDTFYPPVQPGQTAIIDHVSAYGGGFFGVGEFRSMNVAGFHTLLYRNLIVPAGEVAMFQVGALFNAGANGDGYAEADFLSGGFRVLCPAVEVQIV